MKKPVQFKWLGQGGARFQYYNTIVYVDPYLSHSVQELDAPDLVRQTSIQIRPEDITDADWILITHEHIDHCDPHTIPLLAKASPHAFFLTTAIVSKILVSWGVSVSRIIETKDSWVELSRQVKVLPTPAAHPTVVKDSDGYYQQIGFVLQFDERLFYLAGDTFLCDEIFEALKPLPPIEVGILPVNEHNYFRNKRGIIGNMSVRDALGLALDLDLKSLIPVHWDMFKVNSTHPDEILLLHKHLAPELGLIMPTPFERVDL